jgi:EAL domain-containing protein (putative c-di-GMP-specific phosphodiesterase class I)
MAEQLRKGLSTGQIKCYYQPQIDSLTGKIVSVEALVRWQHPKLGLLSPIQFLPAARRSGLMGELTRNVIEQAAHQAAAWADTGLMLKVSVNVAPVELLTGDSTKMLSQVLKETGLSPSSLCVEVTEDAFLTDPVRAKFIISELASMGIDVSIDDYGSGFSSLAYLRDLPIKELKIDRTFIASMTTDSRSLTIVESTAALAKALGLRIVGEGIETLDVAKAATLAGVDLQQGYFFAKPVPSDEIPGLCSKTYQTSN